MEIDIILRQIINKIDRINCLMKYKTYNLRTKKAEWIDEKDLGFPKGINSFEEFLEKYGHSVKGATREEELEIEKSI